VKRGRYQLYSDINWVPMVDALTQILIIYMITAPLMQAGIDVQLPRAEAREVDVESGIVISMTLEGKIFISEQEIPLEELETVMSRIRQAGRERPVFVRADKDLPYGDVLDVVASVKNAGIYNVGLITVSR